MTATSVDAAHGRSVDVRNPIGGEGATRSVTLPAEIFDVDTNIALIHQVVVGQLAAARQGTHSTKSRGEVRGGGRKPYRQKGTGRARQGSTRAPQFVGGGVVHGPTPRNYEQRTPKKMKAAALRQALSDRARNDRVHVVSALVAGDAPSTKAASLALAAISTAKHVLVVAGRADVISWKSLRNVDGAHVIDPGQLNTYDVLVSDDVVFTQDALEQFVHDRGNGVELTVTALDPTGTTTSSSSQTSEFVASFAPVADHVDDPSSAAAIEDAPADDDATEES